MAILSRMAKLGIPLTVVAATAGALFYDDIRGRFSVKAEQPTVSPFAPLPPTFSSPSDTDIFPRKKWHSNWDRLDFHLFFLFPLPFPALEETSPHVCVQVNLWPGHAGAKDAAMIMVSSSAFSS